MFYHFKQITEVVDKALCQVGIILKTGSEKLFYE